MQVVKAPDKFELDWTPSVFLAGSIEMGKAVDWQTRVTKALEDLDCVVLNPRRDDWDSSWEQKKENAQFRQQVEWELAALEHAQVIAMAHKLMEMAKVEQEHDEYFEKLRKAK